MLALLIGLVLFLGVHSLGMVAHGWRNSMVERLGRGPWMGLYALVSLLGFVLIVWGFGQARMAPTWLWVPPVWTRHLADPNSLQEPKGRAGKASATCSSSKLLA